MTYLKALREDAPLLDAYLRYFEVARTPFTIPGHKQRASKLDLGLGAVVDGDTPLYGGLDEIKLTNQTLKSAESLELNCGVATTRVFQLVVQLMLTKPSSWRLENQVTRLQLLALHIAQF
jgi:hypothetical protein